MIGAELEQPVATGEWSPQTAVTRVGPTPPGEVGPRYARRHVSVTSSAVLRDIHGDLARRAAVLSTVVWGGGPWIRMTTSSQAQAGAQEVIQSSARNL
ncbi:hypothetical protein E2562_006071 [Oryza meyeriana var. granulata]|uniref:Uncharacterized protein n=1 Tax=Oryza meyeriana var. granulata TaxID=110450 RepID=A0A6G1EVI0_9ORYZ|nr:hypothetical protein E2562_006071 [Oryza meyeriana var. granulata]